MRTIKFKAILIFFLLLPQVVIAFDECGFNPTKVESLFDFYKTTCNDQGPLTLCECLKEQTPHNAFIKSLFEDDEALTVSKNEYVASQTKRLFSMYTQMTYGDAYQRRMLGLSQEPIVGCSPTDLAKHFHDAVNNQASIDLEKNKNSTPGSKEFLAKVKARADLECEQLSSIILADIKRRGGGSNSLVDDLIEAKAFYESLGNKVKIKEIDGVIDALNKPNINSAIILKDPEPDLFPGITKTPNTSCRMETGLYKMTMQEYHDDMLKAGFVKGDKPIDDPLEGLKNNLKNLNTIVAKELKKSYDNVLPNACYTYSEYKVLSSRPSDALLNALLETPQVDQPNFFLPKANLTSSLEVEKRKFLRGNPIIANTQNAECARNEMSTLFREFALANKNRTEPEKMKAYIDLMKGETIKGLLTATEVKDVAAQNCDFLGRNLAAVMVTDEPGPVPSFNVNNPLGMLEQQVLTCKIQGKDAGSTTNLKATLNNNPLFLLADENNIGQSDSSEDEDYKNFLDANCVDFDKHREQYISEKCKIPEMKTKCLENFNTAQGSQELREEYLKVRGTQVARDIKRLVNTHTKTVLTEVDHKSVVRVNKEEAQDQPTRQRYATQIKPKMGRSIIARRGEEKEFSQEQLQNQQIPGAGTIPAQLAAPDWNSPMPVITSTVLATAKTADLLPVSYQDESPEKKIETIKAAQENLVTSGERIVSEALTDTDKNKVIADLKESIKKLDEEADKIEKFVKTPSVEVVSPKVVASTSVGNSGEKAPFQGSFSSVSHFQTGVASSYARPRPSNEDKKSEAYLKTKYLDSDNTMTSIANRGPASLDTDTAKIVIGLPLNQEIPKDAQVLSRLPLDASSFADKSLIMDKVRAELIKNKILPSEKVLIQFFDKTKNEVLIVNVVWANNQWVISQVPRKSLLTNLNLMLISQTN